MYKPIVVSHCLVSSFSSTSFVVVIMANAISSQWLVCLPALLRFSLCFALPCLTSHVTPSSFIAISRRLQYLLVLQPGRFCWRQTKDDQFNKQQQSDKRSFYFSSVVRFSAGMLLFTDNARATQMATNKSASSRMILLHATRIFMVVSQVSDLVTSVSISVAYLVCKYF